LYPENHPTLHRVKKIAFSGESTSVNQRQVLLSDLDIVNHVNNVKYLEWCLDLVAPQLVLSGRLRSFDMNFMRELALADEVSIVNNDSVFSIVKESIACFALQLDWE
jgi:acyl-ACP thioesterase